jgi:hypothetical protein
MSKRRITESISMPELDELLKSIPLETRVRISLQMSDITKWDNGDWVGDRELLEKQVSAIMQDVKEWIADGMPSVQVSDTTDVDSSNDPDKQSPQ